MAPTVEERRLRMLTAKKEAHFAAIQKLFDLSQNLDDVPSREKFLRLVGSLEKTKGEFEHLVDEVIMLRLELDEKFVPNYEVLSTVEEMCGYISQAIHALDAEGRGRSGDNTKCSTEKAGSGRPSARLPKIELPQFSGNLSEWESFYGLFTNLIHTNPNLSGMDKLYYLVGCLKGQAKTVCAGLSMSEDNYAVVWEALVERYHDKRALANAYLGQILEWRDTREESEKGLNSFLEKYDASVRALKNLNLPDLANFMFLYHALSNLNPDTVNYFDLSRNSGTIPQYEELLDFIKSRVKSLATAKVKRFSKVKEPEVAKIKSFVVNKRSSTGKEARCDYCHRGGHMVIECRAFLNLAPKARYFKVKELNLCYNCLSADHGVRDCPSNSKCEHCAFKHHKLIHQDSPAAPADNPEQRVRQEEPEKGVSLHSTKISSAGDDADTVLLGTARVTVEGPAKSCEGRFLLDSGSQANLVSQKFCQKLGLSVSKLAASVQALGGAPQPVRGWTTFRVFPNSNARNSFSVTAMVVTKITGLLPQNQVYLRNDVWLKELPLADREFDQPGQIEGLFGAEIFAFVLGSDHRKGDDGGPIAMETSLGYVVMGRIAAESETTSPRAYLSVVENSSVEELVKRFWEGENIPEVVKNSSDDEDCETIFQRDTSRDVTGRFTVSLPFKADPSNLGDSKARAKKRFLALESRLEKNVEVKAAYHEAMANFIELGHICPVKDLGDTSPSYYIPHHAVYKANSDSTPVRIVLDASAPSTSGQSLNSILHVGPKLQTDIVSILIRFRLFPVALVADIRQMYRQINVVRHHRRFQRLFWRWNPADPLRTWELGALAFGVTSSPYLALRCIRELLKVEGHLYPETADAIRDNLYMDDLLVSFPDEKDAENMCREAIELFKRGQFDLTKWVSNSENVLEKIPVDKRAKATDSGLCKTETTILGLVWDSSEDELYVNFPTPTPECTKRGILSSVARCFDPLGISAPVILHLKKLVKELWSLKLGWDEEAPPAVQRCWRKIISEWPSLKKLGVKRTLDLTRETQVNVLGFADASQDGFGGVVYLQRVKDPAALHLICAKSRVSPMKAMSIPRLELSAALLLTKLLAFVVRSLSGSVEISEMLAFSDSSTVVQWLCQDNIKDVFVKNRVRLIKEIGPEIKWNHIAGKDNPADGLSRGCSPHQLLKNDLWFNGPWWTRLPQNEWPCRNFKLVSQEIGTSLAATVTVDRHPLLRMVDRKSAWSEILRVAVRVLRWPKLIARGARILTADLQEAERILIMLVQKEHFGDDIRALQEGKEPSKRLRSLRPFLHNGVLRVGGRLSNSDLHFNQRHQLILPKKDQLTERLIDYYHVKNFHTGPYLVEALLRQKFWILGGTTLIKKKIRGCNRCFRGSPKALEPLMADLPEERVKPAKAFLKTGVDYFGPLNITLGRRRGSTTLKAYVALFVCLSVKAIHLELVSSLSTPHFLQAFKRFLSRRGPCRVLYSDRGTNFIGAHRELTTLIKSAEFGRALGNELAEHGVEWKFNPPAAPHMGGLWESQVKAVKRHLLRVVGVQLLSYEELNTLLVQIEGLLNSRPLCQLSVDPSAPSALTPGHFLHQTPLEFLPAENLDEANPNRLNRFQLLDQMVQSFWKRWKTEYLTALQNRQKWTRNIEGLKIGSVVVIKNENSPPLQWPLGVVTALLPGRDGVVRSVKLRCGQKEFVRPVVKVCPLPTQ